MIECKPCLDRKGASKPSVIVVDGWPMCQSCYGGRKLPKEPPRLHLKPKEMKGFFDVRGSIIFTGVDGCRMVIGLRQAPRNKKST